jgi:ribosomal protein S18 acetylase RimI-like enzyme
MKVHVLRAYSSHGIGSRLAQTVVHAARGQFRLLRVRIENPEAGRLYQRLGFVPPAGVPDCNHILWLSTVG